MKRLRALAGAQDIAKGTEDVTRFVTEAAQSASRLAETANELNSMVARFKL